jgi:GT2 family glycosyltransferase
MAVPLQKNQLALTELLAKEDAEFVDAAYRVILGRRHDPSGFANYLSQLRDGQRKEDIIFELCTSDEGKQRNADKSIYAQSIAQSKRRPRVWSRLLQGPVLLALERIERAIRANQNRLYRLEVATHASTASIRSGAAHFDDRTSESEVSIESELKQLRQTLSDRENFASNALGESTKFLNERTALVDQRLSAINLTLNQQGRLFSEVAQRLTNEISSRSDALEARDSKDEASSIPQALSVERPVFQLPALPERDGIWEWADYADVKARIQQERQAQDTPAPLELEIIDLVANEWTTDLVRKLGISLPTPSQHPVATIIVPTYNNIKLTLECLLSISQRTGTKVDFEVIIADDGSSDGTPDLLGHIQNLKILTTAENLGFLKNCNRALPSARGEYVVFLNNDVQVSDGWLATLVDTFKQFPNAGVVGPRYLFPNGRLQEVGAALNYDGTAELVGMGKDARLPKFNYPRVVDYTSGACLMIPTALLRSLNGFAEEFAPCYCEDSDLCLRVQEKGYRVIVNPAATIVHHLSKTTAAISSEFKLNAVANNLVKFQNKWHARLKKSSAPRVLAFYLPQFHPFAENSQWWGAGFTEWTNVSKAKPNFVGHYQPRQPADLGYYDLRVTDVLRQQAMLANQYGVDGFCFYYYWFAGKRLMERPVDSLLATADIKIPFCLCWANENWSRRWDGQDQEVLISQSHSPSDDLRVIEDLGRYIRDERYIRIDGKPLLLVYRVQLFPDFAATAKRWREWCRANGIGEIYLTLVETFELVHKGRNPAEFGCDAAVEFPPMELAEPVGPSGELINQNFSGAVADYRDLATRFATRDFPGYTRLKGVAPGWDNTARMQDRSFCFEHATPGAFQAWLEDSIYQTRNQLAGDERLVFINAWNEWAEGTYLEPDRRFGHGFLQAVRNAKDASALLRKNKYQLGD